MSRFETHAIWRWYLENERRFRRYKAEVPEGHRGRWQTASVVLATDAPLHLSSHFSPRDEFAHFQLSEEWFDLATFPRYESRQTLRKMLSWVPADAVPQLDGLDLRRAPWFRVQQFASRQVVQADRKKVPKDHEAYDVLPVRFFRAQLRRLIARPEPPRALVAFGRSTVHELCDVLFSTGMTGLHGWHDGAWWPVADWKAIDAASQRACGIFVAGRLPGGQPLSAALWHGRPRFAVPAAMPAAPPPAA